MVEILYRGKLLREKTFANCSLVSPKDAVPPNFEETFFVDSHKTLIFTNI